MSKQCLEKKEEVKLVSSELSLLAKSGLRLYVP